jgi:F0F1-type ATP synthase assembly protein I
MIPDDQAPAKDRATQALKLALVGVVGQVGCLTLVIIAAALGAGLWLDNQFQTRPLFALVFILVSVPITLFLMFRVVLKFAPRIQNAYQPSPESTDEEGSEGGERSANKS